MTSKDNLPHIPAQRYFTQDELCRLVGISPKEFQTWQWEYGQLGYGGEHYTRLDVIKAWQLRHTFAPYVDAFTHNLTDAKGEPAIDAIEVSHQLQQMLQNIENIIVLSSLDNA